MSGRWADGFKRQFPQFLRCFSFDASRISRQVLYITRRKGPKSRGSYARSSRFARSLIGTSNPSGIAAAAKFRGNAEP